MIKLTVTSKGFGEDMNTELKGEISGRRSDLVIEVAYILLEFDKLGNDVLTNALRLMMEKLIEEKADEN